MKKGIQIKHLLASMLTLTAVVGVGFALKTSNSTIMSHAQDVEYVLTLDGTNGAVSDSSNIITATTSEGNTKTFGTSNLSSYAGYFGKCDNFYIDWDNFDWDHGWSELNNREGSRLYNSTAIQGIKKIEIKNYTFISPSSDFDINDALYLLDFSFSWGWSSDRSEWHSSCKYHYDLDEINLNETYDSYVFNFYNDCPDFFFFESKSEAYLNIESIEITYTCVSNGIPEDYQGALQYMTFNEINNEIVVARYNSINYSNIVIPATIRGKNVTTINAQVFYQHSEITSITLPSTIKIIYATAFAGTSITEIELPYGIEHVGEQCFMDCTSLRKVYFPNTIKPENGGVGDFLFRNVSSNVTVYTPYASWEQMVDLISKKTLYKSFEAAPIIYNATVQNYIDEV
ncbi:MAG: leucine-rich repeat domain-containing protein, partial [Bacilli bacterium]|nr:leucine-rich repeat domain-containing protein [Bacilli bacterium]